MNSPFIINMMFNKYIEEDMKRSRKKLNSPKGEEQLLMIDDNSKFNTKKHKLCDTYNDINISKIMNKIIELFRQ
jgi:hypothetical protein